MAKRKQFTAVFEQVNEWWIGYVEELPGANTQGRTLEEARDNLKEAIRLILEAQSVLSSSSAQGEKRRIIRETITV
jgi:predicted RNase H-like HicB family nuclease